MIKAYTTPTVFLLSLVVFARGQEMNTVATDFNIHSVAAANATKDLEPPKNTPGQYVIKTVNQGTPGKRLQGHVIAEFNTTALVTQCAVRCRYESACMSYNFNKVLKRCQLNNQDDISAPTDLVTDDGYEFTRKGTYEIPQESLSLCDRHPCQNNGRCLETSNGGNAAYICICTDEWTGQNCTDSAGSIDWNDWADWTPCSVTCGRGWQRRSRQCVHSSGKLRSVFECFGSDLDFRVCEPRTCPRWKDWSDWEACSTSTTCGSGIKSRSRSCDNGGKPGIDRLCMGPSNETAPCMSPACDGAIRLKGSSNTGEGAVEIYNDLTSSWGRVCAAGWNKQNADIVCKQLGFLKGAVDVNYTLDTNIGNGKYMVSEVRCTGKEQTLQACNHKDWMETLLCTAGKSAGVRCIVDGGVSAWSDWSPCSKTCEKCVVTRTRTCNSPAPLHGGNDCLGPLSETKEFSLEPCPLDGSRWKAWSTWSDCTATCGGGTSSRFRTCDGDPSLCNGVGQETKLCNMFACTDQGVWSHWMEWGNCDATCGGGTSQRQRTCLGKDDQHMDCLGHDMEYRPCSTDECPDRGSGSWDLWSQWNTCNVKCGGGVRTRNRDFQCKSPACQSTRQQQKCTCNAYPCPVDGYYLPWSEWASCNETCGGGWRSRDRNCVAPQNGGIECKDIGANYEVETCNTEACPVDGYWKPWENWQACSKSCGGGSQVRNRVCVEPAHGGKTCDGLARETRDCNPLPCPVQCTWNEWSQWQPCNVTCASGMQLRTRTKNEEKYGGSPCVGDAEQWKECFPRECPVDCTWEAWSQWQACNVTCNQGMQKRTRDMMAGLFGGKPCAGPGEEWQICNPRPCPIDGQWEPWADWSKCTVTCNNGTRERFRKCNLGLYGGANCSGDAHQVETCFPIECPVDGVWRAWSEWGSCSFSCGNGTQIRGRTCDPPRYNGKPCDGPSQDRKDCFLTNCPVAGVWLEWNSWGMCDRMCGGGTRTRHRDCDGPYYKGPDCEGSAAETAPCHTHSCPENGYWEMWSAWSECTLTCGLGRRNRDRECISPKNGGSTCNGSFSEEEMCNDFPCPVNGYWETWQLWQSCDVTCGGGSRHRQRLCVEPLHGGLECPGSDEEWQNCNENPCPIDGYWEEWSAWTACNVTCGGGTQSRNRKCHEPLHGGKACEEEAEQWRDCNTQHCPVEGVWQAWSAWESCDVTCAGGVQFRSRDCTPAQYGGKDCQGLSVESQVCNTHPCPVDAYWMTWEGWQECSATCGGGSQTRTRVCVPALNGGTDCKGPATEQQDCNTRPCPVACTWKEWAHWSACQATCGPSTRARSRDRNQALHGGIECEGPATEVDHCNLRSCMIPGLWSVWQEWSACSVSCGGGTRMRSRECNMTSYGQLTAPCIGVAEETGECHIYPCTPLARTCGAWVQRGLINPFMVQVDPDGEDDARTSGTLFWVYCDASAHGGTAAIRHDYESSTQVQGYEGAGEYGRRLRYRDDKNEALSLSQLTAYVDASSNCSQYISWECLGASIHSPIDKEQTTTFWENRHQLAMDYWGDATPGSRNCACGVTQTCALRNVTCNCDVNDNVWRKDEGNITYKQDLPVTAFRAGDTGGSNEMGYWTVGPIICSGSV